MSLHRDVLGEQLGRPRASGDALPQLCETGEQLYFLRMRIQDKKKERKKKKKKKKNS